MPIPNLLLCGLPHNLVKLTDYLSCLNKKFSVIGIFETWLNDSSHSVDISGFQFLHKYRQNRTGGGVGLYISNDLEFKLREDLSLHNVDIVESLFIELIKPRENNIIVGIAVQTAKSQTRRFLVYKQ